MKALIKFALFLFSIYLAVIVLFTVSEFATKLLQKVFVK